MFQCHLITLFLVRRYTIVSFTHEMAISSPNIPYPIFTMTSFNKPTCVAVKLSAIRKFYLSTSFYLCRLYYAHHNKQI